MICMGAYSGTRRVSACNTSVYRNFVSPDVLLYTYLMIDFTVWLTSRQRLRSGRKHQHDYVESEALWIEIVRIQRCQPCARVMVSFRLDLKTV